MTLAKAHGMAGEHTSAIKVLSDEIENNPSSIWAKDMLDTETKALDNATAEQAQSDLNATLLAQTEIVSTAQEYNNEHKYRRTIELLGQHLYDENDELTKNPDLLSTLGNAYIGEKRANDAIDLLVEYYEDMPSNSGVNMALTKAYMAVNESALAIDVLEHEIENNPTNSWANDMLEKATKQSIGHQKKIPEPAVYENEHLTLPSPT